MAESCLKLWQPRLQDGETLLMDFRVLIPPIAE